VTARRFRFPIPSSRKSRSPRLPVTRPTRPAMPSASRRRPRSLKPARPASPNCAAARPRAARRAACSRIATRCRAIARARWRRSGAAAGGPAAAARLKQGGTQMSPSAPFILRPVATSLLMIAILLVGLAGYRYLPLSALPEVDYPTIQVQSFYPGASPDVMTTSVTAILERQFGQMPGLKEMSSVSSAGSSVVTLQFDLNLSLDVAEQEVQAAINAGGSLLPQLPVPPVYAKVNPADAPIITLAITS